MTIEILAGCKRKKTGGRNGASCLPVHSHCMALVLLLVAPAICLAQPTDSAVPSAPASQPVAAPAVEPVAEEPAIEPTTKPEVGTAHEPETETAIKPRLELHVPSVRRLVSEVRRSRAGLFAGYLAHLMRETGSASAEGVSTEEAEAVLNVIRNWADTGIDAATFAPDTEGRARWAIRLNLPVDVLHEQLKTLLETEAAEELFEDITLTRDDADVYAITLLDSTLCYLLPIDQARSYLTSHKDLVFPAHTFKGTEKTEADGASLLVCRLNMTQTEKDSGETFLSSFSVVTSIDYACRVNEDGDWVDGINVHWPPISGMAIKAFFGRVKQTFFVPDEAFGGVVFNTIVAPALLEQAAGFGAQVMREDSGQVAVIGPTATGPIASHVKSEICLTVLPGTGFLPAPDIVVQCRVKHADGFVDDVRAAVEKINKMYRQREQREPWHEVTVRDRTVFWSDSGMQSGSMMMPLVLRAVIFLTKETDAKGRQRDFAVIGWTSTPPEALVRRWLDFSRGKQSHYLPDAKKTNGQLWINWRLVYKWVTPYLNLGLGMVSAEAVLPGMQDAQASLIDSKATVKVKYTGLVVSHQGPVPIGVFALPAMYAASTAEDRSGGSDLARERLASQRLKVLYHHCKLFHKDIGRWPAEVAELDGYVDFAGNPHLLKLKLSSRKKWSTWFEGMSKSDDDKDESGEDDEDYEMYSQIDDDLYVIEWGRKKWTLGIAPGTLEHLEKLCIDQDGVIHRAEKTDETKAPEDAESAAGHTNKKQ